MSQNRPKIASAFTDWKGGEAAVLICLGLLCYTRIYSPGFTPGGNCQESTLWNSKNHFFFPLEKIVSFIPAQHSFCIPLESFKIQYLMLMGERRKSTKELQKSTKNELLKNLWLWDIPCSWRLEGCDWGGAADKETCKMSGKAGIDQEQVRMDLHNEMG